MASASAVVGDLARPQNMTAALSDVDAVIHSAALGSGMSGVPEDDYRTLNTEATMALARAAQRAGVKRFVFLSSIRAQSGPSADHVLAEDLIPRPTDAYGRSKLAAEQGLAELDIDWVALRLVLVYGEGVKGNMAELVRLARMPYPLPVGALRNRRSLLSLDNLVAASTPVLSTRARLRRPLIVSDPEALTIPAMVAAVRRGLGRRPGLVPVPAAMLRTALQAAGRGEVYDRLSGSLVAEAARLVPAGHNIGRTRGPCSELTPALLSTRRAVIGSLRFCARHEESAPFRTKFFQSAMRAGAGKASARAGVMSRRIGYAIHTSEDHAGYGRGGAKRVAGLKAGCSSAEPVSEKPEGCLTT